VSRIVEMLENPGKPFDFNAIATPFVHVTAPGTRTTKFAALPARRGDARLCIGGYGILAKIPMGRWAQPEEVVKTVCFLLSDASSYVTGQRLGVIGGFHIRV
jgi:NAD(P)-dependent dehydrogenase (short-subunit alcohol dehydrogenase family)